MSPGAGRDNRPRRTAEARGKRAEIFAVLMLTCKFYRVLGRRVKTRAGEIDVIALSPSGVLCFIEVKARDSEDAAAASIGFNQWARIARAAELYRGARPGLRRKAVRFDAILAMPRRWPRHFRDAWRQE